jgi:shikimate dehydrogenase
VSGPQRRAAVLGSPIEHSLSPVLHRAAYDALGLADWTYDAHRVPAGGLARFVEGLGDAEHGWRGLSVTAPLKREALALAGAATPLALLAGAANTLVRDDGRWRADNTDVPGAAAAVRERWDGPVTVATVLGGGATAASVSLALAELGARAVRLLVRDPDRAADAVAAVRRHPHAPEVEVGSLADGAVEGQVVVSTIPADAQVPALVDRCRAVPVVFEVRYDPWPTPLAASAGDRVLVGGLDLLVHQAALQLAQFTGRDAPLARMREAGEHALHSR